MPTGELNAHISEATLFADASNQMHTSSDIPTIMRIAVHTGMQLVHTTVAAAGLHIENRLVFSEFCDGHDWHAHQWGFGPEQPGLGDLIVRHDSLNITSMDALIGSPMGGPGMDGSHKTLIAIPVTGKQNDLLACLLFADKQGKQGDIIFDAHDQHVLEQLASMMSVAIENSIQLLASSRAEADLEKSVATYRTLVEQIPAITYIASLDRRRILFVSPQIKDVLGFSQEDFLANQEIWSQQINPEDRDRVLGEMRQSLHENLPFHSEYRMRSKDGRDIWVKDAASKVRDQDQDLYFQGVVYDISERKATEKQLMLMAHYDQLTGLANRVLFHDRLDQVVMRCKRHQQQFAILYLDLDGFKAVNDDLGHQSGDEVLAETAHRLKAHVREVDTVARMGGDEFTIILDDVHSKEAIELVANKLIDAVSRPYDHIDSGHRLTVSMGIATYPDDSISADMLIKVADNAMYNAKRSGKNRCCFHQSE